MKSVVELLATISMMLPKRLHWEEFYLRVVYFYLLLERKVRIMCRGLEAWQIVTNTVLFMLALWLLVEILRWSIWWLFMQDENIVLRFKKTTFKVMKFVRFFNGKRQNELDVKKNELEKSVLKQREEETYMTKLPKFGSPKEKIICSINNYRELGNLSLDTSSGVVYHGGKDLTEIQTEVFKKFVWSNPLHPDIFPGVRKMEAEIITICVDLFRGGKDACGTMTASGTNSILMACKTYRDWARDVKGVKKPEIVMSVSGHPAFEKAAEYFVMKIIKVPVNEKKRTVNIKAMKKAITRRTIMLVGAAPDYTSGIVDNIEEIAKLGKRYKIGVHVDACLGGFLLPFMKTAGYKVPSYDFSVDGVTSISADTHKYGYAPLGSSIIMYHSQSLRHYQYHTSTEWTGGIYATPAMPGSRPGVHIAQCWATMMHLGNSGYTDAAKRIIRTTKVISDGLRQTKGLFVFGEPEICVVSFGSKQFNIFALGDELTARNWKLTYLQYPTSLQICVTLPMTKSGVVERFLRDVKECSHKVLKNPQIKTTEASAIYGTTVKISNKTMVKELANHYLDMVFSTTTTLKPPQDNGI
ncbi:sphingosine-1-phosphate lyase 1-like isoform X2 [Xenia sp. Carnegie-2017]|uniref:sphingosine-1-phosphate lyase 1-like isoform X2 n=1 Tax=Xenia sp. Carnegie-2017 TaxID=2897299 RepID=UPI001F04EBB8|nr:sphingosine-1-phosphate lyase 1-like isoform X2 [Xenia sp. Carnegie-2017]